MMKYEKIDALKAIKAVAHDDMWGAPNQQPAKKKAYDAICLLLEDETSGAVEQTQVIDDQAEQDSSDVVVGVEEDIFGEGLVDKIDAAIESIPAEEFPEHFPKEVAKRRGRPAKSEQEKQGD